MCVCVCFDYLDARFCNVCCLYYEDTVQYFVLQRVQNMAAQLVAKTRKRDYITPILRALHWLPIRHRIIFKVLITFKALNNLTPDYLTLLLDTYKPQHQLRSSDSSLLTVPLTRLKMAGDS